MPNKYIRISDTPSGEIIAEGPVGTRITPFEGNYYIQKKYLRTRGYKPNFISGLCIDKFLYVWMDLSLESGGKASMLGWFYWLANPLFPFVWYRIGVPQSHPEIRIAAIQAERAE